MQVQYAEINVKTEVTVGRALTTFIVDHIDQGRMERKAKVNASSIYSNQQETEVTVGRALTTFIVDHINPGKMGGERGK